MLRLCSRTICVVCLLALALISCTKRKPEEIDYAPDSPWNPYPPDSSENIDHTTLDVTLSWTATDHNSGDVLTYAIYLDTLNPPLTSIASGLTSPSFPLTGLSYNTTYYWNLYITDDQGVTTSGPVWRFTTLPHANSAPTVPSYLYPVEYASGQYPTLGFAVTSTDPDGSSDTLYYNLYLGVTPQPPLTLFRNDTASSWELTGLNYATNYYWKVVVRDNHYAYSAGPLYSFATRECPWFYKRELPSPRYGFGTAVVNGKIYVIGGTDGLVDLAEVLEYDPLLDTWTRKSDMPTARSNLAATVWDNKIYALGGDSCKNEVYDPLLNTWNPLRSPPASFLWTTAHAVSGKIYFLGSTIIGRYIETGIMEYTVNTDQWWDTTYYEITTDTVVVLDSTFIYCDTTLFYSQIKSTLPHNNAYHCSAICNDQIYVFGGINGQIQTLSFVDTYSPGTNTWAAARDMIGPASAPAAAVANGFIYVVGGYDGWAASKRVRRYDPLSDTWAIRSDLQKERSFLGAVLVDNSIYAIGGTVSCAAFYGGRIPAGPGSQKCQTIKTSTAEDKP